MHSKSITDFGVIPNSIKDSSVAFQTAINSFPQGGNGISEAASSMGGILFVPAGAYYIENSFTVPGNIILTGEGAGSFIHGKSKTKSPIEIRGIHEDSWVSNLRIENLTIRSDGLDCIQLDKWRGNLTDSTFSNLILSAKRTGINLKNTYSQNVLIDKIQMRVTGGAAVEVKGNYVHVNRVDYKGVNRADGIPAEFGIIYVDGQSNEITRNLIEVGSLPQIPFYTTGSGTFRRNHCEYLNCKNKLGFLFDNFGGDVDYLGLLDYEKRVRFINSYMHIGELSSISVTQGLSSLVEFADDPKKQPSLIIVDRSYAQIDSGLLDDPRLQIRSLYNRTANAYITFPLNKTKNFVKNEGFSSPIDWSVSEDVAADTKVTLSSTYTKNAFSNGVGRCLSIKIVAPVDDRNKYIWIYGLLNVPQTVVGERAVLQYRVDIVPKNANTTVEKFALPWLFQTLSGIQRVQAFQLSTLTAAPLPAVLESPSRIAFQFPTINGMYYISSPGVYLR